MADIAHDDDDVYNVYDEKRVFAYVIHDSIENPIDFFTKNVYFFYIYISLLSNDSLFLQVCSVQAAL